MTIAELKGKLAPGRTAGYEYMEDLLTSDVFGAMRYAGWNCGFLDWLMRAQAAPIQPAPPTVSGPLRAATINDVQFSFWPKLANGCEPDLALLLRFDTGPALLLLIEVKYLSGMSNREGAESDEDEALTGDQIVDQVWGLAAMSRNALLRWFDEETEPGSSHELLKAHLLVTSHPSLPADYYARSAERKYGAWPLPCYWLSWLSLAECLESHLGRLQAGQKAMLNDLCRLLDKRDLVHFRGGFGMAAWRRPAVGSTFWSQRWWSGQSWQPRSSSPSFWAEQ